MSDYENYMYTPSCPLCKFFGDESGVCEKCKHRKTYLAEKGKTMDDYIKREDALEQFDYYDLGEYLTTQIRGMLMDIPSADVAPVRHGKWLSKAMRIMCSDCGAEFNDEIVYMLNNYEPMNYCPNCGAKMDEGGSNGTDD